MVRRLVMSPWGRGFALAVGLALACTLQSSADPPSATDKPADKPAPAATPSATAQPTTGATATPDATTAAPTKSTKKKTVSKRVAQKKKKKWAPVTSKLAVDPNAPKVDVFDGISNGTLNVKVVPQNSTSGSIYIENPSNQPVTVEMPDAFVAVPVLRQMGGGGAGRGAGGMGGGQAMGGGMGGMGGGMGGMGGGMGGMGGGMFSIPPEHTAKIPFHSVCLEHGKTDPDPTMSYKLVKVSQYTDNDQLSALLSLIGRNAIDTQVAQAAAWHLASNMSWQDLATKQSTEIGYTDQPYFSRQAIVLAQQLVIDARGLANERAEKAAKSKTDEPKKSDTKKSADRVLSAN